MRTRTETEVPHECDLVDDEATIVRITEQIHALRPDVVITFGPDGITGHRDQPLAALMGDDTYRTWWRVVPATHVPGGCSLHPMPALRSRSRAMNPRSQMEQP